MVRTKKILKNGSKENGVKDSDKKVYKWKFCEQNRCEKGV